MTAEAIYTAPGVNSEAYISALEEVAEMYQQGPDYRANVAPGTYLGEDPIEGSDGSTVRYHKRESLLRAGNRPLPERVMLYNRMTGRGSPVPPTIATKRIMQGTKQFPASAFTLRDPGFTQRTPIDEHCRICDRRRATAGNPPRDFYDVLQFEMHMELMHPREWASDQRRVQQDERLEDRQEMRNFVMELVRAMRPDIATEDDEDGIAEAVMNQVAPRKGRKAVE